MDTPSRHTRFFGKHEVPVTREAPPKQEVVVEIFQRVAQVTVPDEPNAQHNAFTRWATAVDANPGFYIAWGNSPVIDGADRIKWDGQEGKIT